MIILTGNEVRPWEQFMIATTSRPYLSLGELAELLSVQSWRIARLFELGILSEPPRIAGRRMIPKDVVPAIIDALRERGWLSSTNVTIQSGTQ